MFTHHTPKDFQMTRSQGTPAQPAEAPARDAAERELTYVVAGMTRSHCRAAVTHEVSRVPGVTSVDGDLETRLVRVTGAGIRATAVVAAIDEAGYDAVAL
jgi:copper chaperone